MTNPFNLSMRIKPKWLFSSCYVFFNRENDVVGTIEYPLIAKIFNSNLATLIHNNERYTLVDSVGAVTLAGQNRFVNTYLKKDDVKILELSYKQLRTSEEFQIFYIQKNLEYFVRINDFGTWDIYLDNVKIGRLINKELLLRRSTIELSQAVPELVQFLIFWGSINTQDVQ